ncbi:hypothetical protein ILUMI_23383 [Ignelater luminosus]|uniref:Uncharacterized protein n=1 Tax=Ignelater luminosus TaxID=2038154 RepID=A0A8K0G1R9_IGNLU|nr:hypothetical protein ILUMI_23383 [Ignelater luminosus]
MNVGTVLFTESDNSKDCWSTENIALLTSRMMLEDILPSREILLIKDGRFITDIIDYFRLVLEVVRKVTYGKVKHIMLIALTDTLGGYLNHFVMPIAKRAFYAGYIDFDNMERLYQLFDEIKCFLRTNGHGWAKPVKEFSIQMSAQPLPMLSPAPKTDPCKGLIVYEKSLEGVSGKACPIGIPMPFFDSKTHPASIAVPFKTYSLRNMESKSASYVLVKFYMAATKCLAKRNANKKSMTEFNSNFYSWIHSQVYPHLNDDKFFSAFGGILRVEETLARMGATQISNKEIGNYNIMPEAQLKEYAKECPEEATKRKKSNLILMALLATIFIWFILGSMFICYRIKAAKSRTPDCYCDKTDDVAPNKSSTSHTSKPSKSSSKMSKLSSKLFGSSKGSVCKKTSLSSRTSKKTSTSSCRPSRAASRGRSSDSDETDATGRRKSPTPSILSKRSTSSVGSRSTSKSSRKPLYPASCACHTSMTGKYRMTSSSEEQMKKKENELPLVFGYELETSSETPRGNTNDPSEDVGDYGAMSK